MNGLRRANGNAFMQSMGDAVDPALKKPAYDGMRKDSFSTGAPEYAREGVIHQAGWHRRLIKITCPSSNCSLLWDRSFSFCAKGANLLERREPARRMRDTHACMQWRACKGR